MVRYYLHRESRIYIKASRETLRDPIDHEHETTVRTVVWTIFKLFSEKQRFAIRFAYQKGLGSKTDEGSRKHGPRQDEVLDWQPRGLPISATGKCLISACHDESRLVAVDSASKWRKHTHTEIITRITNGETSLKSEGSSDSAIGTDIDWMSDQCGCCCWLPFGKRVVTSNRQSERDNKNGTKLGF